MKGKLFQAGALAMTMALASTVALFSSCSSDDVPVQNGGSEELVVSVKPSNSLGTRAAITSGDVKSTTENTINKFVVGIFNANGEKEAIETMNMAGNTQLTIDAGTITADDQVLVAVNVPETTFSDVTTAEGFKAKTLTITQAIYGNPTHETTVTVHTDNNYIPMYGEGTVVKVNEKKFKADVDVYHLISKVTLAAFNVDFSETYAGASFQPTEIFLANVPDLLGFSDASSSKSYKFATPGSYLSGETTTDVPTVKTAIEASKYPYLSTGTLNETDFAANEVNKAKTFDANKLPVFYTMPNSKTVSGKDGATFLVIKGKFTYNNTTDICYYPIFLNFNTNKTSVVPDGGTAKQISPNYNYKVSVFITGRGSDSPVKPVDGSSATINASVVPFTAALQTSQDAE